MALSHLLLGVLAEGPAHGYDIKRAHDDRFPGTKPLAYGQVYAALAKLATDGAVEVIETRSEGGPERTTYALTDVGRGQLDAWLAETESAGPYAADELLRKTVTALRLGADAHDFLVRQRQVHTERMRSLVAARRRAETVDARIALDHAINHLDADLTWLETAAARVAAERSHA